MGLPPGLAWQRVAIRFPEIAPGDPVRISATTYVAYRQCPAQAGARLQGIYGPDSRPSFLGGLAHRIFSRHLSSGTIGSEEFVQACREEIGGSALNHKLGELEIRPSALAAMIEEVRGLYERFVRLPNEGFEGSEQTIDASLGEGVDLVGTVDAIYREELAAQGRAWAARERILRRDVWVADDDQTAWAEAIPSILAIRHFGPDKDVLPAGADAEQVRAYARDRWIIGAPETVAREIARYESLLGTTVFLAALQHPGMDQPRVLNAIRLLGERVLPAL